MNDRITRRAALLVPAAAALLFAAACGGDGASDDTAMLADSMAMSPAMAPGAMTDPMIVTQVGAANGAEIAGGNLAMDKATSADVKAFGQQMVTDHQTLQGGLDSLATSLGIAAQPPVVDTIADALAQQREVLKSAPGGADWDRQYMQMQVTMHENTLDLLNRAVASASNADLRNALQQAIPVVQGHLDSARQILDGMGGAG